MESFACRRSLASTGQNSQVARQERPIQQNAISPSNWRSLVGVPALALVGEYRRKEKPFQILPTFHTPNADWRRRLVISPILPLFRWVGWLISATIPPHTTTATWPICMWRALHTQGYDPNSRLPAMVKAPSEVQAAIALRMHHHHGKKRPAQRLKPVRQAPAQRQEAGSCKPPRGKRTETAVHIPPCWWHMMAFWPFSRAFVVSFEFR